MLPHAGFPEVSSEMPLKVLTGLPRSKAADRKTYAVLPVVKGHATFLPS